jgi:threonine/homoserine/homoserine lactone efflux protein
MMDSVSLFLQGTVVGFTLAASVGPMCLLTVQRTLLRGWRIGLVSGLGIATADALYGFIGGLGLTVVTDVFVGQQGWLRLVGGAVLIYLGLKVASSRPETKPGHEGAQEPGNYLSAYSSIFLLTLSNPMTILVFAAIYTGIGMAGITGGWSSAAVFGLGVFLGSAAWWLILTGGVNHLRKRFQPAMLGWVNRIIGLVIAGFGVWVLFSSFI